MPGHKAKLLAFFTVIDEVRAILNLKIADIPSANGNRTNQGCNAGLKSIAKQEASCQCHPQRNLCANYLNTSWAPENPAAKIRTVGSKNKVVVQLALPTNTRECNSRPLVSISLHSSPEWYHRNCCSWSLSALILQLRVRGNRLNECNGCCKRRRSCTVKVRSKT